MRDSGLSSVLFVDMLKHCCYILNVNRVTIWLRKKRLEAGKPVRIDLGRSVASKRRDAKKLLFVAHAIDQYQDYSDVDLRLLASQKLGHSFHVDLNLRRLVQSNLPADLLLIALCDSYPTERVRRRKKIIDKKLAVHVSRETGITKSEAEKLIAKNPEADWLNAYRQFIPTKKTLIAPSRFKQCPSRIFPEFSRRMISYWRHHKDYGAARAVFGR